MSRASARAHANIALAKYWGKADTALNLPAVPSISLTLDGLNTETTVEFDSGLDRDELILDGVRASGKPLDRATRMLDEVRAVSDERRYARVSSRNDFPTASGLASSASGFCALAAAAVRAAGLAWDLDRVSVLARRASASAARSVFGGFVELGVGTPGDDSLAAVPVAPASHWDVRLVVAVTQERPKDVGSTEGMEHSRTTSLFYDTWVARAPSLAATVRRAILSRDLHALGAAMEQSTFGFHACAMTSSPFVLYWQPATVAALGAVRALRDREGIAAYATMDAGPHVKVLCEASAAPDVEARLKQVDGVLRTLTARPGGGVETW